MMMITVIIVKAPAPWLFSLLMEQTLTTSGTNILFPVTSWGISIIDELVFWNQDADKLLTEFWRTVTLLDR